jgi:hypothetical protein
VSRAGALAFLALACVACRSGEARPLESSAVFRYAGKLVTHVEQPEAAADCGRKYISYETSGFVTLDRAQQKARLEGFGCDVGVQRASGILSATDQACVADGVAGFAGVGLDQMRIDDLSVDIGARKISWRARAWRRLPTGRVSYCFEVDGALEAR